MTDAHPPDEQRAGRKDRRAASTAQAGAVGAGLRVLGGQELLEDRHGGAGDEQTAVPPMLSLNKSHVTSGKGADGRVAGSTEMSCLRDVT